MFLEASRNSGAGSTGVGVDRRWVFRTVNVNGDIRLRGNGDVRRGGNARCNLLDGGIAVVHSRQGEPNEN